MENAYLPLNLILTHKNHIQLNFGEMPIENRTSPDSRSGRIADIELASEKQRPFEAVGVKHGIPITLQIIQDAYEKFNKTPVDRYYILYYSQI